MDIGKLQELNRESSRVFNCNCSQCFFGVFEGRMIVLKPTSPGELKETEKEGAIFCCGFLFLVWSGTRRLSLSLSISNEGKNTILFFFGPYPR